MARALSDEQVARYHEDGFVCPVPHCLGPRRATTAPGLRGRPLVGSPGPPLTRPSQCAILRVMARVNLTLDEATFRELDRHIKRTGKARATIVRELLREGLARRAAAERRKRLAADYAAGRSDARAILKDLESAQLELMDDEEA